MIGPVERLSPARSKVLSAIGWRGAAQAIGMVVRLGSTLILSRLLAPKVYGVFGTALTIIMMVELLSDLGIWPALARHPRGAEEAFLRTGWWIGAIRGAILTSILAALAWPLSIFYHQEQLFPVLLVLSLRSVIYGLRSPGMFLAYRKIDFRPMFVDEVTMTVVQTLVQVAIAWHTHSIWAFVAGTLAGVVTSVLVSYLLRPMRVTWTWDRSAQREIAHLGRQIFANTLVQALWINLDRLLGPRLLSVEAMGFYFFAINLATIIESFIWRTSEVYYSSLARYPDPESKAARSRLVLDRVAAWGMPVMALGVLAAPAVIALLFDRRYTPSRALFGVLVARLMFVGLGRVQYQYLLSLGEIRITTRAMAVAAVSQAALMAPFIHRWGVNGLAFASFTSAAVFAVVQTVLILFRGDGRLRPLLITAAWAVVAVVVTHYVYAA